MVQGYKVSRCDCCRLLQEGVEIVPQGNGDFRTLCPSCRGPKPVSLDDVMAWLVFAGLIVLLVILAAGFALRG